MLQQPQTPNAQTQSPLSPTSSPQSESSDSVQGTANQELLRSEGQTITVPPPRGITEQGIEATLHQGDVSNDVSFQPIEIAAIFLAVILSLVGVALYAIKKSKKREVEPTESMDSLTEFHEVDQVPLEQTPSTTAKNRGKKLTRRQRRQQKQRP